MLVKLEHGTIRYRYVEDEKSHKGKEERRERNHEGNERSKKHGYFFHTKLNKFGSGVALCLPNITNIVESFISMFCHKLKNYEFSIVNNMLVPVP